MSANLSPTGLHAVEPEPDFSEQYAAQQTGSDSDRMSDEEKIRVTALAVLARSKGGIRKTARELGIPERQLAQWKREQDAKKQIPDPFADPEKPKVLRVRLSSSTDLATAQKKLVQVINTIVDGLPKMLAKASLTEQVKTLNQLVGIKGDVDTLLTPPVAPGLTSDELREMAKKKLEMKKKELDKTGE